MVEGKKKFICFTGIDGAGKTTLARFAADQLSMNGIEYKYVYNRLTPWLLKPFILLGQKLFLGGRDIFDNYAEYSAAKRKAIRHNPLSPVYQWLLMLDYYFQVFLKVKIPLMMGKNIVCDRYVYDTLITDLAVDFNYSDRKIGQMLDTFFHLFPRPMLTFLLDVPEEIAYQRKNDIPSIEYLKERRKIYLEAAEEHGMVILDGGKKLEELQREVVERVFPWNPTLKLLSATGSPFVSKQEPAENRQEALKLYNHAARNKIGLLYLKSLKNGGRLDKLGLRALYEVEREKHDKQTVTASRISRLLNSSGVSYAVFKSIMPFTATPNDVDILHFGSDIEYKKAVDVMLRSGYVEIKGQAEALQRMFHDARDGEFLGQHPRQKDVYDVDLYQKAAASYVVYLDKKKFRKYVTDTKISGTKIKVLMPEAELAAVIAHAVITEQLCTLFVYYATLHYLAEMKTEKINEFINIARENHITCPVRAHLSLVAALHKAAHGFIPEPVKRVLTELSGEISEGKDLLKNNFKMPHRYSALTLLRALLEKTKEAEFRRSAIRQAVSMLNPRLARFVVGEIILRRRRETY